MRLVRRNREEEVIRQSVSSFPVKIGVDAWYPTLDKERCTDCGKCHDFCLFGVYTIEDGVVTVKQPQNCKNNCRLVPGCARIKRLYFPNEKSPINGGLKDENWRFPSMRKRFMRIHFGHVWHKEPVSLYRKR